MSSHGIVVAELRCLATLINSIMELGVAYKEASSMRTADGVIHKVDVILKDTNGKDIGFEKTKKGDYRVIADCSGLNKAQLKKQQDLVNKIRQKYAYNTVVNELKKQGYIISEEEKVQNNTIRLTARKWS
jgi:hypothetical protein